MAPISFNESISRVWFTRYRKLSEMDSDGTQNLQLSDFDNMTLEDLDYIVV